ncbi:MAG: 50S ribosomal protein L29 [Nitrososphaerota archaeon]|nr:50S ribosomal protein L29 [Nitrososphaerota archaeon]MDG6939502.1 50S ribosomal protein L29 [Nitrososphaerota archaeon]
MSRLKPKDVRSLDEEGVEEKVNEYRKEYLRLKGLAARGNLAKESGKLGRVRRTLAMLETLKHERRRAGQ